jgi:hypothetical protein
MNCLLRGIIGGLRPCCAPGPPDAGSERSGGLPLAGDELFGDASEARVLTPAYTAVTPLGIAVGQVLAMLVVVGHLKDATQLD